jgi:predicted secreted acid phosphatase
LGRDWILLPNPVYGPWEDLWHQEDQGTNGQRRARLVQRLKFFRP